MSFIARVIRFLFWLLVLSWGVSLIQRLVTWMLRRTAESQRTQGPAANTALPSRRLVRDPICGMHLAETLAIPLGQGDDTTYFCSEECRGRYLSQIQKKAANG